MSDVAPPSYDELVDRARKLGAALRERRTQGDELRRLPDETISDFQKAGFFKILQPARFGGFECHPKTFFDVQIEIAKACPSSAWVLGVVAVHNWQLALFADQAQRDVWGDDPSTLVSSSYAPTGKIERAEGGFNVSGRWSFSSGCDHCQWVFLGGFAPTAEGRPPDMRTFLIPRKDYRIEDNWHVMGLKATGSKDIVVEGVFVPEHRTHRMIDGFKRNSPGNEMNTAPLYRLPFGQIFVRSVSTTSIGATEGALDAFNEIAAARIGAGDGAKIAVDPTTQRLSAETAATLEEIKLVLYRNMDELMSLAEKGEDMPVDRRVQFRFDSSNTAARCVQVINQLFNASGGRAIFLNSPLLRYWLDINAGRAHYANNPDKPSRNFGAVQLGLKNTDFFI